MRESAEKSVRFSLAGRERRFWKRARRNFGRGSTNSRKRIIKTKSSCPFPAWCRVSDDGADDGKRLAFVKVLQGRLRAKDTVLCPQEDGAVAEQKIDELRIYSGERFETVAEAPAGTLCAAVGLQNVRPGDGIGEKQFRSQFRSGACDGGKGGVWRRSASADGAGVF